MNKTKQIQKLRKELKKYEHNATRFVESGTMFRLIPTNERTITNTVLNLPKRYGFQLVSVSYDVTDNFTFYALYIYVGDSK